MLPYHHKQIGRTIIIILSLVSALLVPLFVMKKQLEPMAIFLVANALIIILLGSLTIEVTPSTLQFSLGLGVIRRRVPLADIAGWEEIRISLLSGWGIHRTLRGWLYNVSGLTGVEITLKNGKRITLGTDEPSRLCGALQAAKRSVPDQSLI